MKNSLLLNACKYFREHRSILLFIFLNVLISSCKDKDDSPVTPGQAVGPISAIEFEALPIPTYFQVEKAFTIIFKNNPDLLNNENQESLTRTLFDEIKKLPKSAIEGEKPYIKKIRQLSREEWKVLLLNSYNSYLAYTTVAISEQAVTEHMSCDIEVEYVASKANALRNAYWSALITKFVDSEFSKLLTSAHEEYPENSAVSKAFNLHNNEIGRALAINFPKATPEQLLILLLENKYTFIPSNSTISENETGLVFNEGKTELDKTFTGILSNPDSGGDWDMIMYLNQCGNVLRGEYHITRGSYQQKRRFQGQLDDNNLILNISAPYHYEGELQHCANVVFSLSGSTKTLSGNWNSSNCPLGGVVFLND